MSPAPTSPAARLCAAFGMFCDVTLFHSVLLQPGDSARALSALGLRIKNRKFFLQPCPARGDAHCAIYAHRPARCRDFRCRQLLRVAAGESTEAAALEKIREARAAAAHAHSLIGQITETNPTRALAQRAANALTSPEKTPLHTELESALLELESLLKKNFRHDTAD